MVLSPHRSNVHRNVKPAAPQSKALHRSKRHINTKSATLRAKAADKSDTSNDETEPARAKTKKLKSPYFHRLYWSDQQLGTLSVMPDELIVEICKHLIPPEVQGMVFEGNRKDFDGTRNSILRFMQASSRLYGIARELKCFGERTYHFAVSGLGGSFEGHLWCPSKIVKAAMRQVGRVKVIIEIDLHGLVDIVYLRTLLCACWTVERCMQDLNGTEKRLERYDIEIHVTDSNFIPGKPFRRPATFPNGAPDLSEGHLVTVEELLRLLLRYLLEIQNIRVGNVRPPSLPLTYHPRWNCSLPPITHAMAMDARWRWRGVQLVVDAGAYLLSGWDDKELKWCAEFLKMPGFRGYYTRADSMTKLGPQGPKRPPVYDKIVKKRCRCEESCFHV